MPPESVRIHACQHKGMYGRQITDTFMGFETVQIDFKIKPVSVSLLIPQLHTVSITGRLQFGHFPPPFPSGSSPLLLPSPSVPLPFSPPL